MEIRVPLADRICEHWAYKKALSLAKEQLGSNCYLVQAYLALNSYWFTFSV